MKLLLSFIFAVSAIPVFSQIELPSPGPLKVPIVPHDIEIWRAAHYSDVRYKLNLVLEKMSPVLKGTIEIHLKVAQPKSETPAILLVPANSRISKVPPVILDWRRIAGHQRDSAISNVTINGRAAQSNLDLLNLKPGPAPIQFWEDYEHLVFMDGVVLGENVIKLDFTSPILDSGSAIVRHIDKENGSESIYSNFRGTTTASMAFPVFDQSDLKARFTVSCQVPAGWKFITNTNVDIPNSQFPLCARPGTCDERYVFLETKPVSTYEFTFAAGPLRDKTKIPAVLRLSNPGIVW